MLTPEQRDKLRENHFTKEEIDRLNSDLIEHPQVLDLTRGAWKDVLKRRENWYQAQKKKNVPDNKIKDKIRSWYEATDLNTIWALLRAEYQPPSKIVALAAALEQRRQTEVGLTQKQENAIKQAKRLY